MHTNRTNKKKHELRAKCTNTRKRAPRNESKTKTFELQKQWQIAKSTKWQRHIVLKRVHDLWKTFGVWISLSRSPSRFKFAFYFLFLFHSLFQARFLSRSYSVALPCLRVTKTKRYLIVNGHCTELLFRIHKPCFFLSCSLFGYKQKGRSSLNLVWVPFVSVFMISCNLLVHCVYVRLLTIVPGLCYWSLKNL